LSGFVVEIVLVKKHGEWSEVEEEAHIENSDRFLDETQNHEETVGVRLVFVLVHCIKDKLICKINSMTASTFQLLIFTAFSAAISTGSTITIMLGLTATFAYHGSLSSNLILILSLVILILQKFMMTTLLVNGSLYPLTFELHASSIRSVEMFTNNISNWVLTQRLRVHVIEESDASHCGITDQDQTEAVFGAKVNNGHHLKKETHSTLDESKREGIENTDIKAIITVFDTFLFVLTWVKFAEVVWVIYDILHSAQPILDFTLQISMHEEGSNNSRDEDAKSSGRLKMNCIL